MYTYSSEVELVVEVEENGNLRYITPKQYAHVVTND